MDKLFQQSHSERNQALESQSRKPQERPCYFLIEATAAAALLPGSRMRQRRTSASARTLI